MKRYLFYISQNYSFQILRPLQKAIHSQGNEVKWFVAGNMVNRDYLLDDEIQVATVADAIKYNPLAIFAPGNIIPNFFSGLKVAVFHGFNVGKRGEDAHFRIRGCFDLYCTHGPDTTKRFCELAKKFGYFRVIETGWPTMDPLLESALHFSNTGKPTILLCSTFNRNLTCTPHLYNEVARLSKKGNWRWLVQFHPKMPVDIVKKYKGLQNDNLTFIETDNVIPLLRQADVMVSDTSSVLVMFLLQQKPVVTFRNVSPKPWLHNIVEADKLESAIGDALTRPADLMNAIKGFISQTHPYDDGGSSERVLQAVDTFLAENISLRRKPFNIIRNFKARKKLAYWNL